MQSPDDTVISLPGQSITDASGNVWTIANAQVAVNGGVDPTTANVIEMAYENGTIWQKNTDNLWWSKATPASLWDPPYGTATDPIPNQQASADDTIVTVIAGSPTASITDASGNFWSIANGQVTLDGVPDATTANVMELAYVNGQIWQENASGLWWSKTTPADAWGPAYGTSINPVPGVTRVWTGGFGSFATPADWTPNGIPQAGDNAVIGNGGVTIGPGYANGVNFSLAGGDIDFNAPGTPNTPGTFNTGSWNGWGDVSVGNPDPTEPTVVTTTGINVTGGELEITQFNSGNTSWSVNGNSSVTGGAVLDMQLVGTGGLPRGPLANNGTMTVDGSTLAVGALTGQGVVQATGDSDLSLATASAGETIQLVSAHLHVVDTAGPISTAMQFLADVTDFGANSDITLNATQATSEIFKHSSPTAGELFLYNGTTLVADMHISGQPNIYATDIPPGSAPGSVLLTAYDTGHSLPITGH